MQYSIVNYKKITEIQDFRIDAECFKPIHLQTEELIGRLKHQTIKELAISVINFGAYSLCNYIEFLNEGVSFIVTEDINNNIIDVNNLHFISKEVHKILHKSQCKKNQVLLTMAGAYLGQAAVYYLDFEASSNQAIAKITLKENLIDPYYLATFLNCVFGQSQINRFRTGTGQPNLNLGLIQTIAVPLLSDNFQKYIKKIVVEGIHFHTKSNDFYKKAEQILLTELGLLNWNPKYRLSFVRNFSDTKSANRIDAEYFQPMYEEILNRSKVKAKIFRAEDVFTFRRGEFIDTKYYTSEKTKRAYIRIKELSNSGSINGNKVVYLDDTFSDSSQNTLKENDIVMAIIGDTIGKSNLILNEFAGSYFSNNTGRFRLRPEAKDSYNPFFLETLFHSIYIQSQVERAKAQTGQPKIADKEVKNISIPCISLDKQKRIGEYVRNAMENKARSKYLLDIAKRGVELAVEKTEKDTEGWIVDELKKMGMKASSL